MFFTLENGLIIYRDSRVIDDNVSDIDRNVAEKVDSVRYSVEGVDKKIVKV